MSQNYESVGAKNFSPLQTGQTSQPRNRRSIRLKNYDYAQAGVYFVTVCANQKACLFGFIEDGIMVPNELGRMVKYCWDEIPSHFPNVSLDAFVTMPNHVHGILMINAGENDYSRIVETKDFSPLRPLGASKTLGSIIRGFKIGVSKWAKNNTQIQTVWQRNYWEHIVRSEQQLSLIREYIQNNPMQWELDSLNVNNRRGERFFAPTGESYESDQ